MSAEIARLEGQLEQAQSRLDALLAQREAAMEGCGLVPSPAEIDRARSVVEAAASLLRSHERMASA